ncbi:InlB B-repeat-containing protein [Neofamilia massiliensis]|uniref:InlB B-repeat-containing protein n=1 Tax=Neofamilia massiliensis TaxID=1673724 RepID=UPI0006BB96AA|nr:InlB B-repeat-containing protein [Neofamilia massiliensis]
MNKKLISFLLAFIILFTSLQPVMALSSDNYKIKWLVDNNYVEGRGEEGLELDKAITRAEITKMLVVMEGQRAKAKDLEKTPSNFTDVKIDHWANGYINLAYDKGYIKGYEDQSFRPENQITYEEIITILARLHPKFKESFSLGDDWSKDFINFARENGILRDIDLEGAYKEIAIRQKAFELIYNLYHSIDQENKIVVENKKPAKSTDNSWWDWGLFLIPPIKEEETRPVESTTYYEVRFYTDGNLYARRSVKEGDQVNKPSNPSKTGYSFIGWIDDQGRAFDFSTKIYRDQKLYGQFIEDKIEEPSEPRNISIDPIGPRTFEDGSEVTIPLFVRDKNGLKVKAELEVEGQPQGLNLEGEALRGTLAPLTWEEGESERVFNIKVTATYEGAETSEEFTLTITRAEESEPQVTKLKFQLDSYELPLVDSKTAIVFVEPTDIEVTFELENKELAKLEEITSGNIGRRILPLKSGTTKLVAKAGDKISEATIIINPVRVHFQANGGVFADGSDKLIVNSDFEKINAPEEPTREGYKFAGWYLDDKFQKEFDLNVSKDMQFYKDAKKAFTYVYAKWEEAKNDKITGKVSFFVKNENPDEKLVSSIKLVATADNKEYIFTENPYNEHSKNNPFTYKKEGDNALQSGQYNLIIEGLKENDKVSFKNVSNNNKSTIEINPNPGKGSDQFLVTINFDQKGDRITRFIEIERAEDPVEEGLVSGKYVLVDEKGQVPGTLEGTWVTRSTADPDPSTMTSSIMTLEISGDQVKIKDSKGNYLAPKGGNKNGIKAGDYSWKLVKNEDDTISFLGQGADTVVFANNTGDNGSGYRAYKTSTVNNYPDTYPSKFNLYKIGGASGEEDPKPDPEEENPSEPTTSVDPLIDENLDLSINPADVKFENGKLTIYNQEEGMNLAVELPTGKILTKNVPSHGRWSPLQGTFPIYPGDKIKVFRYEGNVRGPEVEITVEGQGDKRPADQVLRYGRQHFAFIPTARDTRIAYSTEPFFTVELEKPDGSFINVVATTLGQANFDGLVLKAGDTYKVRIFDRNGKLVDLADSNLFIDPSKNQSSIRVYK